jgi:hypothetical protein
MVITPAKIQGYQRRQKRGDLQDLTGALTGPSSNRNATSPLHTVISVGKNPHMPRRM